MATYSGSDKALAYLFQNIGGGLVVDGILTAGATSVTLSDAGITTTALVDIYTDIYGVNPTNAVVAAGSITLTFDAQLVDVNIKVKFSE